MSRLEDLIETRNRIVQVRGRLQFDLPLANAKLIRITNYIGKQVEEAEHEVWRDADLLEIPNE